VSNFQDAAEVLGPIIGGSPEEVPLGNQTHFGVRIRDLPGVNLDSGDYSENPPYDAGAVEDWIDDGSAGSTSDSTGSTSYGTPPPDPTRPVTLLEEWANIFSPTGGLGGGGWSF